MCIKIQTQSVYVYERAENSSLCFFLLFLFSFHFAWLAVAIEFLMNPNGDSTVYVFAHPKHSTRDLVYMKIVCMRPLQQRKC